MPLVRIDIVGPKDPGWTTALLSETRAAVSNAFDVEDERIVVRVVETPRERVSLPGCRTDRFTQIEVVLYEGRSDAVKAEFVRELRRRLAENPGIESCEIAVDLRDRTKTELDVLPGRAGPSPSV